MKTIWNNILTVSCVGACLCSSCYNDDKDNYDPDMTIRFSPAITTSAGTRASAYPVSQPFKVWAFSLEPGKSWNDHASMSQDWILGDEAQYQDGSWHTSSRKLWNKKDETITFFAYAPNTLDMSFDKSGGLTCKQFNTLKDHTDILYTDAIRDVNKLSSGGEVVIPFKHALSKVSFRIVSKGKVDAEMRIKSVLLDNVAYSGNFQSIPLSWETGTDMTALEFCDNEVALSQDEQQLGGFLVIPQSGSRPLSITYDLYLNGEKELIDQRMFAKPILTKWKPGNEYIYTLEISNDEVIYKTDLYDGYVN